MLLVKGFEPGFTLPPVTARLPRLPGLLQGYGNISIAVTVQNRAKFIKNSNYFLNLFVFKEVTAVFYSYRGYRAVTVLTAGAR